MAVIIYFFPQSDKGASELRMRKHSPNDKRKAKGSVENSGPGQGFILKAQMYLDIN